MKDTAVVTYLDNKPHLRDEFNWLYDSWGMSGSWTTSDLVVFHHPEVKFDHSELITIPLEPLSEQDAKWSSYPFINSIWFLTTIEAAFLAKYRYVLRTDHDCFLTPYFPTLRPRLATFGIGMYAQTSSVVTHLANICNTWNIIPQFNNVGSTFMTHGDLALQYSQLQFNYCERLLVEEFQGGDGEWPYWFKGVLSMYAGNLAANAFFGTGLTLGGLDVHCMSHDKMCSTDYHIHAWHTYDFFSKFEWHKGKYDELDFTQLDPTRISNYCLYIAGKKV